MASKKTGWYKVGQKPERKGVYETRPARTPSASWSSGHYQYWDGKIWHTFRSTPAQAKASGRSPTRPNPEWRGFTTEQGGKKNARN